jgi:hypothetical protein
MSRENGKSWQAKEDSLVRKAVRQTRGTAGGAIFGRRFQSAVEGVHHSVTSLWVVRLWTMMDWMAGVPGARRQSPPLPLGPRMRPRNASLALPGCWQAASLQHGIRKRNRRHLPCLLDRDVGDVGDVAWATNTGAGADGRACLENHTSASQKNFLSHHTISGLAMIVAPRSAACRPSQTTLGGEPVSSISSSKPASALDNGTLGC